MNPGGSETSFILNIFLFNNLHSFSVQSHAELY